MITFSFPKNKKDIKKMYNLLNRFSNLSKLDNTCFYINTNLKEIIFVDFSSSSDLLAKNISTYLHTKKYVEIPHNYIFSYLKNCLIEDKIVNITSFITKKFGIPFFNIG